MSQSPPPKPTAALLPVIFAASAAIVASPVAVIDGHLTGSARTVALTVVVSLELLLAIGAGIALRVAKRRK